MRCCDTIYKLFIAQGTKSAFHAGVGLCRRTYDLPYEERIIYILRLIWIKKRKNVFIRRS